MIAGEFDDDWGDPTRKHDAVIVDIDGTLADVSSVRHFVLRIKGEKDFDSFHRESAKCPPHQQCLDYISDHVAQGHHIIFVTGRMQRWEELTVTYINLNAGPLMRQWFGPFMRDDGDHRSDVDVKRDIHFQLTKWWNIVGAIDDNPNIIALWKELGIPVDVVPGWDHEAAASYVKAQKNHGAQP